MCSAQLSHKESKASQQLPSRMRETSKNNELSVSNVILQLIKLWKKTARKYWKYNWEEQACCVHTFIIIILKDRKIVSKEMSRRKKKTVFKYVPKCRMPQLCLTKLWSSHPFSLSSEALILFIQAFNSLHQLMDTNFRGKQLSNAG